jgi:GTPase SAR1 family protein
MPIVRRYQQYSRFSLDPPTRRMAVTVVTCGDHGVGKTCLLLVYDGDEYPGDYEPTLFEGRTEYRTYKRKEYCFRLSGEAVGPAPYRIHYSLVHCVLICFALDDPDSLKHLVAKWYVELRKENRIAPVVLVGTKSDLWQPGQPGAITQADIDSTARQIRASKVVCCSAKTKENLAEVFDVPIETIFQKFAGKRICPSLYPPGERDQVFPPWQPPRERHIIAIPYYTVYGRSMLSRSF